MFVVVLAKILHPNPFSMKIKIQHEKKCFHDCNLITCVLLFGSKNRTITISCFVPKSSSLLPSPPDTCLILYDLYFFLLIPPSPCPFILSRTIIHFQTKNK